MPGAFKIEPLGKNHNREDFSCGDKSLDQYLKTQASQAVKKGLAAVFVLTPDGTTIAGYYTLSSYAIKLDDIPMEITAKLTRMPEVPATLIGRLARHIAFRGQRIGEILLVDALKKALRNCEYVASWAVIVDAKNQESSAFYRRYGFISFPGNPQRLFLPMKTAAALFSREA